jgi:hypothetical protein
VGADRSAAEKRRYCHPECANPDFNECADCWKDGGNPALHPQTRAAAERDDATEMMAELGRQDLEIDRLMDADDAVLGCCPHGVNLDREFCPKGCRV